MSTWVSGLAQFELAVLALREAEAGERAAGERMGAEGREDGWGADAGANGDADGDADGDEGSVEGVLLPGVMPEEAREGWARALAEAGRRLDAALGLAGSEVDLSTRLDSRIMMLRDEIAAKREMLEM